MKNKMKYLSNPIAWQMFGNMGIKAIVFFSIALFTRIMSVEDYGLYNVYLVYEGLLTAVMGLGLNETVKVAKFHYENKYTDYLKSISLYSVLSSVLFAGVMLFFGIFFVSTVAGIITMLILVANATCNCLTNILTQKYIINGQHIKYTILLFAINIPQIVVSLGLILSVNNISDINARIIGHTLPLIVLGIICLYVFCEKGKFSFRYLGYCLKMGMPLMFVQVSASLLSQSDRIFIQHYCGDREAGLYSGIVSVTSILYIIMLSLENVWMSWFYKRIHGKEFGTIRNMVEWYWLLFAFFTSGMILCGPEIVKIILSKQYTEAVDLVIPLSLSWFFVCLYITINAVEVYYKKTIICTVCTVSGMLLNILLNVIYIPMYGYVAAGYTTLFSYMVVFVLHYLAEKIFCKSNLFVVKQIGMSGAILLVSSAVTYFCINNIFVRYTTFLLITLIIGVFARGNRNKLRSMINAEK